MEAEISNASINQERENVVPKTISNRNAQDELTRHYFQRKAIIFPKKMTVKESVEWRT